jgi:hypothetical protein
MQRGTNYGQAQLGPFELQNCNLIDQELALLFGPLPSPVDGGRLVNRAWELHFGYVPGLMRNHELAHKKGDHLRCLFSLPTGRSQQNGPFLGYPLCPDHPFPYHDGGHHARVTS